MKKLILFSSAAVILILNSCTTQMYVSNAVNAPLLKEKGEVHINVTQNDLQVAAALGKNFGVMANGFYMNYKDNSTNYKHDGILGEAAIGYFKPYENNLVFEAFVGAGGGRVSKQQTFTDNNNNSYLANFNANATKFFIQPDIGYKTKYFDAVFSPRFSAVKYTSFDQTNYPEVELHNDYLDNNNLLGPIFMFAEPAVTLRGGYKFVKLQFQYGLTINMTPNDIKHADNFSSLGLVINIAKWYNNNNNEDVKIQEMKKVD
ncbi:MAG: hypothetical protein H0W73_14755 [Bacteroidetes bacterium]|nr:hypothetical protein [Bacteroidota bacterium]